jgi:hypothetical protein
MTVDTIRVEEVKKAIHAHFLRFHEVNANVRPVSDARFGLVDGVVRCYTGIPYPFYNSILECDVPAHRRDSCIADQLAYFGGVHMPFVWYVDPATEASLGEALTHHRFSCPGEFQAVGGILEESHLETPVVKGITYEVANDDATLIAFNDLYTSTFGMRGLCKEMIQKQLIATGKGPNPDFYYWIAKKNKEIYSILTVLIHGDVVSCWNGATAPAARRYGLSASLRHAALQDAMQRGCRIAVSYQMREASFELRKGAAQTEWKVKVYMSPAQ